MNKFILILAFTLNSILIFSINDNSGFEASFEFNSINRIASCNSLEYKSLEIKELFIKSAAIPIDLL